MSATLGRVPPAPGRMGVDFEERVDFDRLRDYRLARARAALDASDLGALLLFDINNIRYVTSTMIGEWARDKVARCTLLTRGGEPVLWDFGSAARHHRLYAPWLAAGQQPRRDDRPARRGGPRRGPVRRAVRARSRRSWPRRASPTCPSASTSSRRRCSSSCSGRASTVRDGQQVMLDARQIKSPDEIMLLSTAAAMVDGVYQDIAEVLKPGIRENEIVALANKRLYEMGSDDVEAINAISGERCSPHPHVFSDRLIRPGDQAYFDIIQSFNGYRTCYYRTFAVGRATPAQRDAYTQAREWMDAAIELVKPGVTHRPDRPAVADAPRSSASPTRWARSACSSATASAWACTSGRSSAG